MYRIVEADEEIDVTEVSGEFFTNPSTSDKIEDSTGSNVAGNARQIFYWLHKLKFTTNKGPNLQAVTEALFDNCEDYQSIHNMKNAPIWRPY